MPACTARSRCLTIFLSLALAGTPALGGPRSSGKAPQAQALYSWACGTESCFALLPQVEPRRTEDQIFDTPGTLTGVDAVVAAVAKLPAGTPLDWIVPFMDTRLAYPYPGDVARVRRACMDQGVLFYGPEGPLAEAADFPSPARSVKYGERLYYLDHKVVALPDFTIRYLGSGALGERPPHAHYQEFEVGHAGTVKTIRTDPNFGAWTPTYFELGGREYVFEVDISDLLRTGSNHGDLWAWTRDEHERRQQKLYGNLASPTCARQVSRAAVAPRAGRSSIGASPPPSPRRAPRTTGW